MKEKYCLAIVYEQLDKDGRALRQISTLIKGNYRVGVICANTSSKFDNVRYKVINFDTGRKLKGWLKFNLLTLKYIWRHRKEIYFLYMLNSYMLLLGFISKKYLNINWVYDSYENLIISKRFPFTKMEKYIFLLEKFCIKNSSLVVAANNERARLMKRLYRLSNVTYVMNIIHKNQVVDTASKPLPNAGEDFWILYQGVITKERNLSLIISSLQYLPLNYKLRIIGSGDEENLKILIEKMGLCDRVVFEGRLPYNEMLKKSLNSHLGIVYYISWNLNTYYCSPNKIFEYANMHIPIISSSQRLFRKIFSKYKIGAFLEENATPEKVAKIIEEISLNYDTYTKDFCAFNEEYNSDNESNRIIEKLKEIL